MPVRYYLARPFEWTPFTQEAGRAILVDGGCQQVDSPVRAHVIVAPTARPLLPYAAAFGPTKRYLVWAEEIRYDQGLSLRRWLIPGWARLEVMNVFNGEIFFNEAHFFHMEGLEPGTLLPPASRQDIHDWDNRTTAFLVGYQNPPRPCIVQSEDISLDALRTELALQGARFGRLHLYGRNFPPGLACHGFRSEVREENETPPDYTGPAGNWQAIKRHILRSYHFNLCPENSDWGYYITEKIWQSIQARCLPVYYARRNRIDEFFPPDSYVNYADFDSPDELFDFLNTMSPEEYLERLDRCIQVYNRVSQREANDATYRRTVANIVRRLHGALPEKVSLKP